MTIRILLTFTLAALAALAGCGDGSGEDQDAQDGEVQEEQDALEEELPPCDPFPSVATGGDGADMSAAVPAGQARAGKIANASELPPGVKTWAEVGDVLIRNSKVGFVIENTGGGEGFRSNGYNPYGGEFVFADVWTAGGPSGQSMMGEIFYGLGLRLIDPDTVTVMNDGSDGSPAVVRVTGTLAPMPLLDIAAGELLDPRPFGGEMYIDYSLGGGDEHIRVTYHIRSSYTQMTRIMLPVFGAIMGDGMQTFTQTGGFDPDGLPGNHEYFGFVGGNISYGFLDGRGGQMEYVLEESGVLAASLSRYIEIEACGEVEVPAVDFVVAGGGPEALAEAVRRMKGEAEPPALSGVVTVGPDEPAAGARVHVTLADGTYVTTDICDADGAYSVGLEAGSYQVTVVLEGHATLGPQSFEMGAAAQTLDLEIEPPGSVLYTVEDGDGNPLPCKIIVTPETPPAELPRSFGEMTYPGGAAIVLFETDGAGEITLPAGSYSIFASMGYWYETDESAANVTSEGSLNVDLVLERVVDAPGYLCGDFHQHAMPSPDSGVPPEMSVASSLAEGMQIIVSTDHDWIVNYETLVESLGLTGAVKAFGGEEITSYEYGHFNAYPMTMRVDRRNNGAIENYYRLPEEVFADALADPLGPVFQINHPRSTGAGGYFNYVGLDPATCEATQHPEWWSDLWNVVEVFNGSDFRQNESTETQQETVEDWFGFLSCGKAMTATGNSDSHDPIKSERGYPRNCLEVGFDDPSALTEDDLTGAIIARKVLITGGPFITADIGGAGMGETAAAAGGRADLNITVQAPLWMAVDRMRIFVSGVEMAPIVLNSSTADPANPVMRFNDAVPIDTGGSDGWVVVEVEGDEAMDPVVRGQRPFAVTNPIFIDAI